MTEELIGQLGYVGIALVLVLGGLGLPIPEEAPIILAAVLTRNGQMSAPVAIATCLVGVLLGDFIVYFLGFFYGEKVLSLPLTRRLLTRQREAQIKGYFHRHGFKILVSGRFVPGFRTAAYLTAGILKLPPLKLLLTDLVAATLSTSLVFGLALLFARRIENGFREFQQWVTVIVALGLGGLVLYRYYRAQRRAGLPIGPRVLEADEDSLPSIDLYPGTPASVEASLGSARGPAEGGPSPAPVEAVVPAVEPPAAPVGGGSREPARVATEDRTRTPPTASSSPSEEPIGIGVNPPPAQPSLESPSRS